MTGGRGEVKKKRFNELNYVVSRKTDKFKSICQMFSENLKKETTIKQVAHLTFRRRNYFF